MAGSLCDFLAELSYKNKITPISHVYPSGIRTRLTIERVEGGVGVRPPPPRRRRLRRRCRRRCRRCRRCRRRDRHRRRRRCRRPPTGNPWRRRVVRRKARDADATTTMSREGGDKRRRASWRGGRGWKKLKLPRRRIRGGRKRKRKRGGGNEQRREGGTIRRGTWGVIHDRPRRRGIATTTMKTMDEHTTIKLRWRLPMRRGNRRIDKIGGGGGWKTMIVM